MKKYTLYLLLVVALFATSCAPTRYYGRTLVTKNSEVIRNAHSITPQDRIAGNDTLYYQIVDTAVATYGNIKTINDSVYTIAKNDILSGSLVYANKQKDGSFEGEGYVALKTLPKDTVLSLEGSVLTYRALLPERAKPAANMSSSGKEAGIIVYKYNCLQYVLSLADSTHYMIPQKQLKRFYKDHCPEVYKQMCLDNIVLAASCVAAFSYLGATVPGVWAIAGHDPVAAYVSAGLAALGTAFCIPAIICSKKRTRTGASYSEQYNQHNYDKVKAKKQSQAQVSLNAHVNANGVGMSLQF